MEVEESVRKVLGTLPNLHGRKEEDLKFLIMFSSGADSTALLLFLLKNTCYNIHVHHVEFRTAHKRYCAESEATKKILALCREEYRDFEESYSVYNEGEENGFVYQICDEPIWAFIGARMWYKIGGYDVLCLGFISDDNYCCGDDYSVMSPKLVLNALFYKNDSNRDRTAPDLAYPLAHSSKNEVVNSLPQKFKELSWSCRQPDFNDSGEYKCCDACGACLQIIKAQFENEEKELIASLREWRDPGISTGVDITRLIIYTLYYMKIPHSQYILEKYSGFLGKDSFRLLFFVHIRFATECNDMLDICFSEGKITVEELNSFIVNEVSSRNQDAYGDEFFSRITFFMRKYGKYITPESGNSLLLSLQRKGHSFVDLQHFFVDEVGIDVGLVFEAMMSSCDEEVLEERSVDFLERFSGSISDESLEKSIGTLINRGEHLRVNKRTIYNKIIEKGFRPTKDYPLF
ncbi:MAG: 7-cyano-7-deazaguanine synthase in queuosine biosynthesis [Chlamydiales bacterium]|jgi:7-cyano-7-deazaguanine synthase in queuosine biosynthesis